jgi:hypothetical protein
MSKFNFVSGNTLKIIAAMAMVMDHVGLLFFPYNKILRVIGRLSFPIFSFMIAEGCKYTKNRLRYFLGVFFLGAGCQIVYSIFYGDYYFNTLITFSLSILLIYSLQNIKRFNTDKGFSKKKMTISICIFLVLMTLVYILNEYLRIDYGFWGCMLAVFASAFQFRVDDEHNSLKKFDKNYVHVFSFSIGLIFLFFSINDLSAYIFLSLPLLMLYSGKRGIYNMKYFFYAFYPLHFIVLELINTIIS